MNERPDAEKLGEAMAFFDGHPVDLRYRAWESARVIIAEMLYQSGAIERLEKETLDLHQAGCAMSERATELQDENMLLQEGLDERTLQHKVQLDNADRLAKERDAKENEIQRLRSAIVNCQDAVHELQKLARG